RQGVGGGESLRVRISHARRQVVRFVEQEQRARGIEAGLFEEEAAVARGKDVVVVADPDVVEREGGAGDFVGTDARVAAGGAERVEIARVTLVEIETREPTLRP